MKILLSLALDSLKGGDLIGLPTETVYGLAADAKNREAVNKVFAAKGRPADHPLIIHIGTLAELSEWAKEIPHEAYQLAEYYWPGPLTLVLKKQEWVLPEVTGGQDTVAIRMPNHPLALALLKEFGSGLVAPSANRFGRISPTEESAVLAELGSKVKVILPGGRTRVGIESTILDMHAKPFILLRQGMISQAALEAFLGESITLANSETKIRAPGLLASHYAPRTPLRLIDSSELRHFDMTKSNCIVLAYSKDLCIHSYLAMPTDVQTYAHELYAALRAVDHQGFDLILVENPPQTAEWVAIQDRLNRAAAKT